MLECHDPHGLGSSMPALGLVPVCVFVDLLHDPFLKFFGVCLEWGIVLSWCIKRKEPGGLGSASGDTFRGTGEGTSCSTLEMSLVPWAVE